MSAVGLAAVCDFLPPSCQNPQAELPTLAEIDSDLQGDLLSAIPSSQLLSVFCVIAGALQSWRKPGYPRKMKFGDGSHEKTDVIF